MKFNAKRYAKLKSISLTQAENEGKILNDVVTKLSEHKEGKIILFKLKWIARFSFFTLGWFKQYPPIGFLAFFLMGVGVSTYLGEVYLTPEIGFILYLILLVVIGIMPLILMIIFLSDKNVKYVNKIMDQCNYDKCYGIPDFMDYLLCI